MANTKYSDLLPYVLPELPGCSSPLAETHIRNAVIELCRRSKVWSVDTDSFTATIGEPTYDVDLPSGTALVDIRKLYVDGIELDPTNAQAGDASELGTPRTYLQRTPDVFTLSPTPNAASVITMTLAVTPTRASTAFPDWIGEKYHEGIVAGAKARLMMIPGQVWSNPQLGTAQRALFDQEVGNANGDAARSFARTTLRTTTQH